MEPSSALRGFDLSAGQLGSAEAGSGSGLASKLRLGTQGWSYSDWVGPFYPPKTPQSGFLEFYSRLFPTVELDTTFYGPPRPETVRAWDQATPADFSFAAKLPKAITHDKRLVGAEPELVEFLTAVLPLGTKLGPLLVQLPPSFTAEEMDPFRSFLEILPDEFRYAVEFRHPSWLDRGNVVDLLAGHDIAWTILDLHGMPRRTEVTTDFAYIRWLGRRSDITKLDRVLIDRDADIEYWAVELDRIARRTERMYGYINNHYAGHSPATARSLASRVGLPGAEPESLWPERQMAMEF